MQTFIRRVPAIVAVSISLLLAPATALAAPAPAAQAPTVTVHSTAAGDVGTQAQCTITRGAYATCSYSTQSTGEADWVL